MGALGRAQRHHLHRHRALSPRPALARNTVATPTAILGYGNSTTTLKNLKPALFSSVTVCHSPSSASTPFSTACISAPVQRFVFGSVATRLFWQQKIAAPTTSAAISGLDTVPQIRTIRHYFASKTSGIPIHSFIPTQLFAFAGTWIDLSFLQS